MACTTILVGKAASYDGSTMIARNDDSGSGHFTAKKFTVIHPEELPKTYRGVLSHVEINLNRLQKNKEVVSCQESKMMNCIQRKLYMKPISAKWKYLMKKRKNGLS